MTILAGPGMPFDNIMVFPQGRFSTEAIRALKSNGFTAAANSDPWPVDNGANPFTLQVLALRLPADE
jgi:hypothetical protein